MAENNGHTGGSTLSKCQVAPRPESSRLTLRFSDRDVEAGYLISRRPLLARRVKRVGGAYLVFHTLALAGQGVRLLTDLQLEVAVQASVGFVFVLAFGLGLVTLRFKRFWRHNIIEAAVVSACVVAMSAFTLLAPKRLVKLQGKGLQGYDSDSSLLIVLDAYVTVTHLGLPVRWFMLVPLEASALLLYAFHVAVIGSEEPRENLFFNCVGLLALVTITALSKRAAEMEERKSFSSFVSEKALRCQAEFQLSQLGGVGNAERAGDGEFRRGNSIEDSENMTDRSGNIFELKGIEGLTSQLEQVAAMGESEHWRIPDSELRLVRNGALGRGSFGSVRRGLFCGMLVAVKSPRLELGALRVADLCNELRILRHLRHPHIVASHGAVVMPREQQLHLVLELIDGPNLTSFLLPNDAARTPSGLQRYQVMLGVCGALLYMHSRVPHIVHGDIKGENIMVELTGGVAVAKVLDFGLSRVLNVHARSLGGSLAWVAPEVLGHVPPRCSADVYSFGYVLAFCATGTPPMRATSSCRVLRVLRNRRPLLPSWPEGCPFTPGCEPLVRACLQNNAELRPKMQELHHALLTLAARLPLPSEGFLPRVRALSELLTAERQEALPLAPPLPPATLAPLPEEAEEATPRHEVPSAERAAMEAELLRALGQWATKTACCGRHGVGQLARDIAEEMLTASCASGGMRSESRCQAPEKGRHLAL